VKIPMCVRVCFSGASFVTPRVAGLVYLDSGLDATNLLSLLVIIISFYSSRLVTRTKECIKVKSMMV